MAKYTIELRELFTPLKFNPPLFTREEVENWFKDYNLEEYLTQDEIKTIIKAGVWNKNKLARQIVDHYYMREIGFETPMLFKHYVKVEMEEIMEEYLPLIYSNSIKYDVLTNVDFSETYEANRDNTGTSNSTSSSSSSSLGVNSDVPQGQISKAAILNGAYASSTGASENENSTTDTTSTTNGTVESYTKRIKGNNGAIITNQRLIKEYRDNIRAINKEIIKRLNYLFMGLY